MRLRILAVGTCILVPAAANAQPAGPVSRADVGAAIGSLSQRHDDLSEDGQWTHTVFRGFSAGYYWTDHLKTEAAVAWAGTAEAYASDPVDLPGVAPWVRVFSEHSFDDIIGSIAQTYQFGRNAMFHPFVTGGLEIVRQTEAIERPSQSIPLATGRSISIPAQDTSGTSVFVRPFLGAGFKAYVSDRAFLRTDLELGVRNRVEQVTWKAGLGFDF